MLENKVVAIAATLLVVVVFGFPYHCKIASAWVAPSPKRTHWHHRLAGAEQPFSFQQEDKPILKSNRNMKEGQQVSTIDNNMSELSLIKDEVIDDDEQDGRDDDDDDDDEQDTANEGIAMNDDDEFDELTLGLNPEHYIVQQYVTSPHQGFDLARLESMTTKDERTRIKATSQNITLPCALLLVDPTSYPSLSMARRACRRRKILIHRGPLEFNATTGRQTVFVRSQLSLGMVGDRVHPGDVLAIQTRISSGKYPLSASFPREQPFEMPVVYEDDHFALVDKPAGVVTYNFRKGGHGMQAVHACLPFCIAPPSRGIRSSLRRPHAVHRLDRPTSGILVVAKTRPAMVHLASQFKRRVIQKTYTAIVNGIPKEAAMKTKHCDNDNNETTTSSSNQQTEQDENDTNDWHVIHQDLDEKEATTWWKCRRFVPSLKARENTLTLVELKPKTGRYHQIRRHMAESPTTLAPLVGDKQYDGGDASAMSFRERGLFLCSNRIVLEHPHYNTDEGRKEWEVLQQKRCKRQERNNNNGEEEKRTKDEQHGKTSVYYSSEHDKVMVSAEIELPAKFENFLTHEASRANKFSYPDGEHDDK